MKQGQQHTLRQRAAADRYIRGIRNRAKREYAVAYRLHMTGPDVFPEPGRGTLGVMGAQAVRMSLAEIFRNEQDSSTQGGR